MMYKFKFFLNAGASLYLLSSPLFAMLSDEEDGNSKSSALLSITQKSLEQQIITLNSHSIPSFTLPIELNEVEAERSHSPSSSPLFVTPGVQDEFNFLSTKYPHLITRAERAFERCHEEIKHYTKLEGLASEKRKSFEEVLMEGAKDVLGRKTLHWFGEKHENFVLDQIQPMIIRLQRNHPTHGYFSTFFKRALTNHTVLEDILLAAEYIFQIVKDEGGGSVLFLGRTPCIVQIAYEELLKIEGDETQEPVHLNFSGHPDALTKRESDFFKSKINIARDMVSPDKLSHYFSYLDQKNILKAKSLFIVDILGSGGSLNSFLRIMNAYYKTRATEMPKLSFLNLSADMNWSIDRKEFYTFEQRGDVSNRGILTLPEDKSKNMALFQVRAYGIPIFDKVVSEMLDQDMFQEFLVHGVQYPAQKWTPEFDTQRASGGEYHDVLYQHLRHQFSLIIPSHKSIGTLTKER